ncbi:MAG: MinD/ParA family protein [Thermodesulfovibrionales bacterium]
MLIDTETRQIRTITVTSGKGGVGKTSIVANLAVELRNLGKRVMVLDADLGLGSIGVLFDLAPRHTIRHVLSGEKRLKDVIVTGPHGIKFLPAGPADSEMTSLSEHQRMRLIDEFDRLDPQVDFLLVDTGPGISPNVSFFCIASQEIMIVTSPEPAAIAATSALMQVLFHQYREKEFRILVNLARSSAEARDVFRMLSETAGSGLNISLDFVGFVPFDDLFRNAAIARSAFLDLYPSGKTANALRATAKRLVDDDRGRIKGTMQFFFKGLFRGGAGGAS